MNDVVAQREECKRLTIADDYDISSVLRVLASGAAVITDTGDGKRGVVQRRLSVFDSVLQSARVEIDVAEAGCDGGQG